MNEQPNKKQKIKLSDKPGLKQVKYHKNNNEENKCLNSHIKKVLIFKCTDCDKTFKQSYSLTRHNIEHHKKSQIFKCTWQNCAAIFKRNEHVLLHIEKFHKKIKYHKCDFENCSLAYFSISDLKVHKSKIHKIGEVQKYKCDLCVKEFVTRAAYQNHSKTHGTKNYICQICKSAFYYKSLLNSHHNAYHTTEKPFACDHCSFTTKRNESLQNHIKLHEKQKNYKYACEMQDCGTQKWKEGDVKCSIRIEHLRDMDIHIERNHTKEGIAKKFASETKLAEFFTLKKIPFDREWTNYISFKTCKNIEGNKLSARPDFYLLEESVKFNCVFLVGNDEFSHRQYKCDFQRTWNLFQSLQQTKEFSNLPLVYIRFNPHHFTRDGIYHCYSLVEGHEMILKTIQSLTVKQLKPGINLVYINYNRTNGILDIFQNQDEEEDYSKLFKDYVILDV